MVDFPQGTVTFLLTDVEGSTALWEQHPEAMRSALARHDEILESSVSSHQGVVVRPRGEGDSRFAVFAQAENGVGAAMEIQQRLSAELSNLPFSLKIRAGMNTGSADLRMGDYYGSSVNRCARIRGLAHGGQTLLSQVTAELVQDSLPDGVRLVNLGTHRLKGLGRAETIYQLSIPGLVDQFPPLDSTEPLTHNLPLAPTRFIGREREVVGVVNLLLKDDVRLVTLTGTGGTGKTRLGLEVAGQLLEDFPQGVFFVDLAPIRDPTLVVTTIAHTIGIREGGGRPPIVNLKDYLTDKKMFFVLDNFEQVIAAAPVVAELLAAAPEIKMLVTSRIALQLRGEREVPVPPLILPPKAVDDILDVSEYESVRLFTQQASAVQPSFKVTSENARVVAEICRRLDGLPLAIEIAAARIKMLPLPEILKRLDQSLKLLTGGAADSPDRHQTLRGAIDWSFDLLKPAEQRLFARLAVFAGGFSLESAEGVCNPDESLDVFAGIEALLNCNLLQRVDSVTGEARFIMQQTIHAYALEKLEESGEAESIRRAHAEHFTAKVEPLGDQMLGPHALALLASMDEEHDNLRTALSWSLKKGNDPSLAVTICFAIFWFWYRYGHFHEGRAWSEQAAQATYGLNPASAYATVLGVAGMMAMWEGDLAIAAQRNEEALRILETAGDEGLLTVTRLGYGVTLINQGRYPEAYAQLTQAGEHFDQLNARGFKATTLVHLANAALGVGNLDEANRLLDQALPIVSENGDQWQIAFCLNNYGEVARVRGDYQKAKEYYLRTDALFREADAQGDHARSIHTLAYLSHYEGDDDKAKSLFNESLVKFRQLGNRRGIAECLAGLAILAVGQGRLQWGTRLLAAAEALLSGRGGAWWPADRVEIQRAVEKLESSLGLDAFQSLWQKGQKMGLEEALAYAAGEGG